MKPESFLEVTAELAVKGIGQGSLEGKAILNLLWMIDPRKTFDVLWNSFTCDGLLIFTFVVDKMKGKGHAAGTSSP